MKKLYFSFCSMLLLTSCATRVDYIGKAYAPSQQVDVFVDKSTVGKSYDVIGKGYAHIATPFTSLEKVQKKAVSKARQKGAHAVIIEDYFVLNTDSNISTTFRTDSTKNITGDAQAHPSVGSGFQILFIRYKP
jgi:hypothetical protein